MSSKNVIYGFQVAYGQENNDHIIDSNDKAAELIAKEELAFKEKQKAEERARRIAELEEAGTEIPEGMDIDEFLGLADSIMGEPETEPEPEIDYVAEAKAEAERILTEANTQAKEIMEAAQVNAEALKNLARQDGEKEGYNAGTQQAAMELKAAEDKMQAQLDAIQEDFTQRSLTLEHDIVDMCLGVFEKVFMAELAGKKEVLFHLLDRCILGIDKSKQMQIKVNEANAEFINSRKSDLMAKVGSDVVIDVIIDPLLDDSGCIVETDGGIFDCSIDTELDNLIREIRALS